MPLPPETAWFPTRKYGWGWGLPRRWQGWIVFLGYCGAVALGIPLLNANPAYFIGYIHVISILLLMICWTKGEKPRWRWGNDDQ